eukprot:CAMPEP_0114447094 /NCGR_PEP_ID=MMETSP0103-20121206/19596_1 /TAXON_ID=37642 ORGANISM="Paraphysomonas imperforata, Strain PA2" /NCGR_SAMPLE_ID=MMETSP0103 /ASSEMBLY_ACC=CAM_ASM_000201 /LENGTH=67 /DNA_ID=CAMNT_0001618995 /DNA_START=180 /DNA_END=384 /DNA_ORIENTATION=-
MSTVLAKEAQGLVEHSPVEACRVHKKHAGSSVLALRQRLTQGVVVEPDITLPLIGEQSPHEWQAGHL